MSGRTDTTYSISTSTNSKTVNYYDDSGSPLFFKKLIVVNFLEAKNDYRVTYGRNSYLVSSSNSLTFKIPSHTVIIFTRFADLSGIANASDTYLNLFGTDEILALDFRSNGTLNISTMKSTAYCDFVAFNFSTAKYDHHLVLVGTKAYRHKLLDGGNKYCTYSTGASKIIPESNIRHYSIDQFGKRKYDETYDEKSIDGPSITIYLSSLSMMNNKMTFINNGTSNETNYILHTYSKQHFYQIGFYSPSDIMTHAEEGEEIDPDNASKISPGKIAGIIIGAVVVLLIIIAIPVICLIYGHHSTDVQEYPLQSNPLNLNLETSERPVQKPTYYPERSQRTQSYSRPLVNPYPQQQQVPYYAQPPSPQDGYITPAPIMPLYPAPETKDGYL
ncbi:hypothetical protein TVAG_043750 [Trichomonas vaginalis G3]|uniref:Uncharacterized protein n=1 Tax=Trichomonas vaginalis (strain ATCC PRA-98 / G3) TaxID=412133 RepID=A2EVB5_TRIV3|nr:hypothetical protein TVAGG3_0826080 [Trichomonas vaginalis G3]EAY03429.1 hypothetical protein TVAG_043750 [Trichomonas vaginalis G3]KAI5498246.1 hypothetical protein TVAGG3_0826080 [Trichomonas vaginalis G3]|eukprot:XP_001315652.1 hypothetical protein [Trichomonas vaginalis G3]